MKSMRWMWMAAGIIIAGGITCSMAPDLYRYFKIRSM
jgi:hypothetical protein